jgi:hypothetical protein
MKFMIGHMISMSYRNHRPYRKDEPPEAPPPPLASPFIQNNGRYAGKNQGGLTTVPNRRHQRKTRPPVARGRVSGELRRLLGVAQQRWLERAVDGLVAQPDAQDRVIKVDVGDGPAQLLAVQLGLRAGAWNPVQVQYVALLEAGEGLDLAKLDVQNYFDAATA